MRTLRFVLLFAAMAVHGAGRHDAILDPAFLGEVVLHGQASRPSIEIHPDGARVVSGEVHVPDGEERISIQYRGPMISGCEIRGNRESPRNAGEGEAAEHAGSIVRCTSAYRLGSQRTLVLLNGTEQVGFIALTSPPQPSFLLPWTVAVICAVAAVMSGLHWWRGRDVGEGAGTGLTDALRTVRQRLKETSEQLPEYAGPPTAGASPAAPAPHSSRPMQPRPQFEAAAAVLGAVGRWCQTIGQRPEPIEASCQRLRSSLSHDAAGVDARKEIRDIVRNAVAFTDGAGSPADASAERELRVLVQAAGLTLIEPRLRDRPDDGIHRVVGRDAAPTTQERQLVSGVERRGLLEGQTVLARAEVRVYD